MEQFEYNRKYLNLYNTNVSHPQQQYLLNTLKRLFQKQNLLTRCNTLLAFHGTSSTVIDSICQSGLQGLRTEDGGYFGAGIYLTPNINYAIKSYSVKQNHCNENGDYCVLVCLCVVGNTYPLTFDVDYCTKDNISFFHCEWPKNSNTRIDKALKQGFDSHFIGVKERLFYQAPEIADESDYYELVLSSSSQVLPIAVVYFRGI